uniref:uncharacterized protein LOC120327867 n=1 Tax=Styela clava TaxID=7725 RepID=UPI00193AC1A8|nr:uncharacterized protein LOC120327867 [Styela clava]
MATQNKHMICKNVDDVFAEDEEVRFPIMVQPTLVGYKACLVKEGVEKLVTSRIEELEERMLAKLDELDEKILQETCDGVVYLGQCYIASLHTAQDVNYDKAVAMCTKMSAKPADIIDYPHYDMIFKYIRTLMSSSLVEVMLAMTFNHSTKRVLLSNGNTAPYTNYYSGYPRSTTSHTQMGIIVRNPSSGDQGMYNYPRLYDRHGVLCRKELFSSN